MDDKPLVVAIDDFEPMRPFYVAAAEKIGVFFMAGSSIDKLPLPDASARLLFVDSAHLPDVAKARMRGYRGGAVLISGSCPSPEEYRALGVDEAWGRPLQFEGLEQDVFLQALMRKYTSGSPRVLCVGEARNLEGLDDVIGPYCSAVFAETSESAMRQVPSVRAAVIFEDNFLNGSELLARIRRFYDGEQLPVAIHSNLTDNASIIRDLETLLPEYRRPYTVLHAEDDDGMRSSVAELIGNVAEQAGCPVVVLGARDGREAIDLYRGHGSIDLVVTDFNMPKEDGREVIKVIRALNQTVPIILFCTGAEDIARPLNVEFAEKGRGTFPLAQRIVRYAQNSQANKPLNTQ